MDDRATHLSRTIAYAIRHKPHVFNLKLDTSGSVAIEELIDALKRHDEMWRHLTEDEICKSISISTKKRFEVDRGRIRALYGHSVRDKIEMIPEMPPDCLYHGTTAAALDRICRQGLISMRRQYVHLSPDLTTAVQVARRRTDEPIVLKVSARQAAAAGCRFYRRNEHVWLSDTVAPSFLKICDDTR